MLANLSQGRHERRTHLRQNGHECRDCLTDERDKPVNDWLDSLDNLSE